MTFPLFANMMGATKQFGHVCHRSPPGSVVTQMVGGLLDTCYQFTGFILATERRAGNIFA